MLFPRKLYLCWPSFTQEPLNKWEYTITEGWHLMTPSFSIYETRICLLFICEEMFWPYEQWNKPSR